MKRHYIKISPQYFDATLDGVKKAEIRNNDRNYQVGDELFLQEYYDGTYTGRCSLCTITHILEIDLLCKIAEPDWVSLSITKPVLIS
jgi:hypothetical protein